MKRHGILLLCVAILVLFQACGEESESPPAAPETAEEPVVVPMPPSPPPPPLEERARGFYVFRGENIRLTLDLQEGGRFQFFSVRNDGVSRRGDGTWSIGRDGLRLTYRQLNGEPLPDGPQTVVNRWRGRTIELRETGLEETVILTKRSAIRER